MTSSRLAVTITRIENGYIVKDHDGVTHVFQEKDDDTLQGAVEMLQHVVEFFDLLRSRHARERIRVVQEAGDKYEPSEGEVLEERIYWVVQVREKEHE